MDQFKDKVAIVTGGASGIGQAVCEELCRRGTQVVIADINDTQAQELAEAIGATGGRAQATYLDVANHDLVQNLVADTVSRYGRLDYMFNNAAATATRGELLGLPIEPWQQAIDVNLLGVVYGSIAAQAAMVKQGFGHIVNIGSIAGLVSFPTSIPYGATKAAVVNLSVALRIESADLGVKVSVVCPGPIHAEEREHVNLIGVERAAELILKGVAQNKAIVVFPMFARVLYFLYRLSPRLLFPLGRKFMRSYRAKRKG